MVAYPYQMPSGIAGAITRPQQSTVEQAVLDQTTPPGFFGIAVKKVNGKLQPIQAGDTAASIVGFLVRPYPTSGNGTDGLGAATPNTKLPGDLLKRGYMSAKVFGATTPNPAAQGKLYVRVGNANGTTKIVGQLEAANEIAVTATGPVGTGNGTIGSLAATDATPVGNYTAVATGATQFNLVDANGDILGSFPTGALYTADNGLALQITVGGVAFTAGATFTITVADNTILVPGNSYFTGGADAGNISEIAYNI